MCIETHYDVYKMYEYVLTAEVKQHNGTSTIYGITIVMCARSRATIILDGV